MNYGIAVSVTTTAHNAVAVMTATLTCRTTYATKVATPMLSGGLSKAGGTGEQEAQASTANAVLLRQARRTIPA